MKTDDEIRRRFKLGPAKPGQGIPGDPQDEKARDLVQRMARFGVHITYEKAREIIIKESEVTNEQHTDNTGS